ncbi:hypothetical protein LP416_27840 [Polaromonas sp. P2-4]|nr:hypothetical protein LP416_27840 [Polaromonas sp. P2-4]
MSKKPPLSGTVTADPASEITGVLMERPDDAHPGEPIPLPEPEGGWPADEFTGKGGSYVRDPFTGLRSPAVPAPETPDAAASDE